MRIVSTLILGFLAVSALAAPSKAIKALEGTKPIASAVLEPRSGSKASGKVDFTVRGNALLVKVDLKNVAAGKHGFHVHEKGDCSAADAASAGGHYNPGSEKHSGPHAKARHLGDLGNVEVPITGTLTTVIEVAPPAKAYDWKDFVGKSVVLHQNADDLKTEPSGNSGDRIACGVIQTAPEAMN